MRVLNEDKVLLSPLFSQRIKTLHDDKMKDTDAKIRLGLNHDSDDWGFVWFPEFKFKAPIETDARPLYGPKNIGKLFRRFMNEMPKYVNRASALGGAWVGPMLDPKFFDVQLDTDDKFEIDAETRACWEKYRTSPGYLGMNHCGPDMKIGLQLGWQGLLEKVRYYRGFNNPANTDFYDGEEAVVLGIQEFVQQTADKAREMAAAEEDPAAKKYYLQFIDGLANALLTMQYVMDPDCFVLGGGITSWPELLPEIKAHIDHLVEWRDGVITPNVRLCTHRNDANILGAVYHLKLRCGLFARVEARQPRRIWRPPLRW